MRSILREIRSQPPHIREIFMWVCVVIVFSVIGFAWFRSTQKRFVALLRPETTETDRILAQPDKKSNLASPLDFLTGSWRELSANISELITGQKEYSGAKERPGFNQPVPPQKLPTVE